MATPSVKITPKANPIDNSFYTTTEDGDKAYFNVVLTTAPTQPVKITFESSDDNEGTVVNTVLTFTEKDWFIPKQLVIEGVNDGKDEIDGNQHYNIYGTIDTTDPKYIQNVRVPVINLVNIDKDKEPTTNKPTSDTDIVDSDGVMDGGEGSDTYVINAKSDTISDSGSDEDVDEVSVNVKNYTLPHNIENATLKAVKYDDKGAIQNDGDGIGISLTGNAFDNTLTGNAKDNILKGMDGADTIDGGAGDDTIDGGNDGDNITGGAGNDLVIGGKGNDTFVDGDGEDTLLGGDGEDTVEYGAAIKVNLREGKDESDNYLKGIENVTGSTNADDITGNGSNNNLNGSDGNDTLDGGKGNDKLDGGDSFFDKAVYDEATTAVYVDLAMGTAISEIKGEDTGAGNDTLANIEDVEGSDYNDTLNGDQNNNELKGGRGDDTLDGGGAADTLNGGIGVDTVSYAYITGSDTDNNGIPDTGVTVDLSDSTSQNTVNAGFDTLVSIENLIGSDLNDTITGTRGKNIPNIGSNILDGGKGDDILKGNDEAVGINGDDVLIGGIGNDTATYAGAGSAVTVDLSKSVQQDTKGAGKDTLTGIEKLIGSDFNDTLTGSNANDTLDGAMGSDKLLGGQGDDSLLGNEGGDKLDGGDGNDTLAGGIDSDTLIGGNGIDIADYSKASTAVTVNLRTESGNGEGSDTLLSIENVTGSDFADNITGDKNNNTLMGGKGVDVLNGSEGNDALDGGEDNDTLDGGLGDDTLNGGLGNNDIVDYSAATATVTVNLATGSATGAAGSDSLSGIEQVIGSNFDDSLTSSDANDVNSLDGRDGADKLVGADTNDNLTGGIGTDTLSGNGGDDTLDGGEDNDSLSGGTGQDSLSGGAGDDTLAGGNGVNVVDGGIGTDTIDYSTALAGVTVDLSISNGAEQNTQGAGDDTLSNIENILGSDHNDILTGNAGNNTIEGGKGDDELDGNGGTASYAGAASAVTVDLSKAYDKDSKLVAIDTKGAGKDKLDGIDNLLGSAFDDVLIGNDFNNILDGGKGADTLDGGKGNDTVSYASAAAAVNIDLSANKGAGNDALTNIENVIGSDFNDTLVGDTPDTTGVGGSNTLTGGKGDDILQGKGGDDSLDGGDGIDTAIYSDYKNPVAGSLVGVAIDLADLTDIENLVGSALNDTLIGNDSVAGGISGANSLTGDAGNDRLTGMSGNDVLDGGAGDDLLKGGDGDDVLTGGAGIDTADYSAHSGAIALNLSESGVQDTSGSGTDTLTGIENVIGGSGADNLIGDANNNRLQGNSGDDTLSGGEGDDVLAGGVGSDVIAGGAGNDTADYFDSATRVTINLLTAQKDPANPVKQMGDTLSGIENVTGSAKVDTLTGDDGNNILNGNAGANILAGGKGNDTLNGGTDADNINGGEDDDVIDGGDGPNTLAGDIGDDTITGGKDDDTITGDNDDDRITGGDGNDFLDGGIDDDVIAGGIGEDTITGGSGIDTLNGDGGSVDKDGNGFDDTFVIAVKDSGSKWADADVITDFSNDDDTLLGLDFVGTETNFVKEDSSKIAGEKGVLAAAQVALDGNVIYYLAWNVAGDGYLYYDADGVDGDEVVIKLAGVNKDSEFEFGDIT